MAISIVGTSTGFGGANGSVVVVTPTGGASGDLLMVCINNNGTSLVTDNNGATPLTLNAAGTYDPVSAAGGVLNILSRVMTGAEPGTLNFTLSSNNRKAAAAFILRGQDSTSEFDIAPGTAFNFESSTNAPSAPGGINTTTDNAWAIAFVGIDSNLPNWFSGVPTGYTALCGANGSQACSVAYKAITPAGTIAQADFAGTNNQNNAGMIQFAVRAQATAGTSTVVFYKTLLGVGF